jgi:hypothetical protein
MFTNAGEVDNEGNPRGCGLRNVTQLEVLNLLAPMHSEYPRPGEKYLLGFTGDNVMEVAGKHLSNLSKQNDSGGAYLPFASALVCTRAWVNITWGVLRSHAFMP